MKKLFVGLFVVVMVCVLRCAPAHAWTPISAGDWSGRLYEDGYVMLNGYSGESKTPLVPDYLGGHPVGSWDIPTGDFSIHYYVSSMHSNAARAIGGNNFFYLEGYPNVRMKHGHGYEVDAFGSPCDASTIVIPPGVTRIGRTAFYCWNNLEEITIPDSVTTILTGAFDGCRNLTSITIPEGVTQIGLEAFLNCESLTRVELPDSLTEISDHAFRGCTSLASITLPAHLQYIGPGSLDGIEIFATIGTETIWELASQYSFIDPRYPSVRLWRYSGSDYTNIRLAAGPRNEDITEATIPENAYVSESAFSGCTKLENVVIEDGVSLESQAFYDCTSLTSVTLPDNIDSIDEFTFARNIIPYCKIRTRTAEMLGLSGRTFVDHAYPGIKLRYNDYQGMYYAWAQNTSITEAIIPEDVFSIGSNAFEDCTNLTRVVLPEGLRYINRSAFKNCSALTRVILPESTREIGREAFSGCAKLAGINLPARLTDIGTDAFRDCDVLSMTVSHESLVRSYPREHGIPYSFVYDVDTATLPKGLTELERYAFAYSSFQAIYIPQSCRKIGEYAFFQSYDLLAVHFASDDVQIDDTAFSMIGSRVHIFAPSDDGTVAKYARSHSIPWTLE